MSEDKTSLNAEFMVTETDPELAVLQVLANYKWATGFVCRKCGHDHYCAGKKPYSRRCTKCKTEESATAHTVFHRCRIPLTEAVKLAETVCKQPDISTYEISRVFEKRQMTCWKFKTRIMECLTDKSKADLLKHLIAAIN
ncbi:MAG: transposase [Bacteroidales bacterium]|jgi:hypothetical protein|nr:transposase [Bacteroidales bacterium]